MTDLRKAAELALDALEWYVKEDDVIESMAGNEPWVEGKRKAEKSIQALRQALSQPEQEKYVDKVVAVHEDGTYTIERTPLYTAPPKREWVGLTEEDWKSVSYTSENFIAGAEWARSKLKEKNT